MIRELGWVTPGTKLIVPFHTYSSDDPSASMTITGLATTDIEVYKGDAITAGNERSSDSGFALIDTDGIDLDGLTGIHGVSIDLADNTDAGFWEAGEHYTVIVASITLDAATINFVPVTFRLGYPAALLNAHVETYASQTSFTLSAGSTDDDAYNGWVCLIHDVDSVHDVQIGVVSDYTGSTKTVTLAADPGVFTFAATDGVALFPPVMLNGVTHTGATVPTVTTLTGHTAQTGDSFARLGAPAGASVSADIAVIDGNVDDIETDTNELQGDWTDGGRLDLILDAIQSLLDDARTEPGQGAPPVNPDAMTKIDYLYKSWRNKKDNDGSTTQLYADDATTVDQKQTTDASGGTVTKGEWTSGP